MISLKDDLIYRDVINAYKRVYPNETNDNRIIYDLFDRPTANIASYRLSTNGYDFIKNNSIYTLYIVDSEELMNTMTSRISAKLKFLLKTPYYLNKKMIAVTDEEISAFLYICNNFKYLINHLGDDFS